MNSNLSKINPTVFSLSAIAIAVVLCEEFNFLEQNSIGNWLNLLGDYLLTNSAQIALINGQNNNQNNANNQNNLENLQKAIKKINEELEKIKRDYS